MATSTTPVDVDVDTAGLICEEAMEMHSALMAESRGNTASAHNIIRHSGARKYNQEDPIEAASVELILKNNAPN